MGQRPASEAATAWLDEYMPLTRAGVLASMFLEAIVNKVHGFLKGSVAVRVGAGLFAFVLAYTTSGLVNCPMCGNQGLHPWEWGVVVGV